VRVGGALLALALAAGTSACGSGGDGDSNASPTPSSSSLVSQQRCAANKAAGTINYVSPFGFDASAGIIDAFAAQKLGYFKDMCLSVSFITNSPNYQSLVSAGRAQMTNIGSAADLMLAVGNNANLIGVSTYANTSNYAILAHKDVTTLKQLEGKAVGYHFTVPVVISQMLTKAGVDVKKVKFINTTNYDPNQLFQGRFDAMEVYRSNEPLVLHAAGKEFTEFDPGQFGVSGTYDPMVANKDFLAQHRSAVQDFLRAQLHAFHYCVDHVTECVSIEASYARDAGATYDVAHDTQVWKFSAQLVQQNTLPGKGIGVHTAAEWTPEYQGLQQLGLVKSLPPLSDFQDTELVASLYNGATLNWPG
jgi:NitT/TauT family transport system substrate-binding protein